MVRLIYSLSKTGSWVKSEEIYEVCGPITLELFESLKHSEFVHDAVIREVDNELQLQVLMKEKTLSCLPLFLCPPLLPQLKYMTVQSVHRWMFGALAELFPEAIRHIPGVHLKDLDIPTGHFGTGRTPRDIYLHRIVRSWMSKRTIFQLQAYLWEGWMKVSGHGALGPMKRAAPSHDSVVGTLMGNFTLANHLIQVPGIENSRRG